jgi:steroid delta-isomerase-like uncharacterized protein
MPQSQDVPITTLEHLNDELGDLSACWQPRAQELGDFLERWERAWNTRDLDALVELVSEDITWEDPAMHGETVHGRAQFRAFTETLFDAFPDVTFQGLGTPFVDLGGAWMAVRWRMTGTFTGGLQVWSKQMGATPPTIAPTGNSFDIEGVDLYELHDGVLANYCIHYDLLGFSQQLGLFS